MASLAVTTASATKGSPPMSPTPWYVRGASYQTTVKPVDLVTLAAAEAQVRVARRQNSENAKSKTLISVVESHCHLGSKAI